jgi:hypothetical protein
LAVGEGKDPPTFIVHKKILCAYSPFFEAACKPEWMKPEDRVIKLPEDDPETIKAVVYWMYNNDICIPKSKVKVLQSWKEDGMQTAWGLLVKLFIAGDKFQIPRLKNGTISALVSLWQMGESSLTPTNIVRFAFDHTSDESPLRKALIMMLLYEFDGKNAGNLEELRSELSAEALFELVLKLQTYVSKLTEDSEFEALDSPAVGLCEKFHDHTNDSETSRKKCPGLKAFVQ